MKKRFYEATNGFHDLMPGQTTLKFSVVHDDKGQLVGGPTGKRPIAFNEVQTAGDPDLRREYIPDNQDSADVLLMDNPDYDKLFIRHQTMAGLQIPLEHSNDFVARWVCLSLRDEESIQHGTGPIIKHFKTSRGNWGGIKELSLKREMVPYIDNMDDETRESLINASSSRDFARIFVNWRDGIETLRIKYRAVSDDGGKS